MSKRPVAFRVPRLWGDMVSHYFVTTSEDEARAMADTNQVEYEGLYLVGDRHTGDVAQAVSESIPRASHTARQGGWRLDFDWLVGMQDGIEEATGYNITLECLEEAVVRTEAICTASQPPAAPVEKEVQDTWLVGGPPDFMAMSGSVESDRVIQLHMRRKATDEDRKWLLDAINAKLLADKAPPQCSAGTASVRDGIAAIISDKASGNTRGFILNPEAVADAILQSFPSLAQPQSPLPASMALAFASERERLVETLDLTPGALISYLAGYDEATELALALSRPHGGGE